MAMAQASLTHRGTATSSISPKMNRARVMMPMVFWASLRPWLVAMKAADTSCILRKMRLTLLRMTRAKIQ